MGSFARSPRSHSRRLAACLAAGLLASIAFLSGPPNPIGSGSIARAADDDPFLLVLQGLATDHGKALVPGGAEIVAQQDALADVSGPNDQVNDVVAGGYAWLPTVPDWLRDDVFGCDKADVACPKAGSDDGAFDEGAYLFYERVAASPGSIAATKRGEWGPVLALAQYPTAPISPDSPFAGGSHAVITRNDKGSMDILYFNYINGQFAMFATNARSLARDNDFLTLIPKAKEIQTDPVGWDVYASSSDGTAAGTGRDTLRGLDGTPLLTFNPAPKAEFQDAASGSSLPPSPATTSSVSTSADQSPAGVNPPISGVGGALLPILALLLGIVVLLILLVILPRPRRRRATEPSMPEPSIEEPPATPEPPEMLVAQRGPADLGAPDLSPLPPRIPIVPPAPPPKECDNGDEEWRDERPARSFVVPPADAKVHIASDPTTAALEAWLFTFGFPRGAPISAFAGLSADEREHMLAGLPTTPSEIHWTIEFQLDDYRLACQRKWVCNGGALVPTGEVRLLESGPDPDQSRYAVDGPALTVDDVRRIWDDAGATLAAAEAAVAAMKVYRADCGRGVEGGVPGSGPVAAG